MKDIRELEIKGIALHYASLRCLSM
jgi:hypothetical protein